MLPRNFLTHLVLRIHPNEVSLALGESVTCVPGKTEEPWAFGSQKELASSSGSATHRQGPSAEPLIFPELWLLTC